MKILLTTLNSKYIHSSLALRYLKNYVRDEISNVFIEEYTVNNDIDYILGEVHSKEYDIICFSCYIWNIKETLEITKNIKKINSDIKIVLGGPEVSYDAKSILSEFSFIDYIIYGEGEGTLKELLKYLVKNEGDLESIDGLAYRVLGETFLNKERSLINNLEEIPFPYDDLEELDNQIIYYESSRGCPFNCQYCLSSTICGVRFFPMDRIKKDLKRFIDAKVDQVKFVDRTFNANKKHSLEIMKYLQKIDNGKINFHFEITASLIDKETLDFLKTVREGLFQFEIGVQSTNEDTLTEIDRNMSFDKLSEVCTEIVEYNNIHLHLDLIAGLPYEGYNTFLKSFDDVYNLKPDRLQLGFLKLLKGSAIRDNSEKYSYTFKETPPYEVLKNNYISYGELLRLKYIEEMIELYYNSHHFDLAVRFIINNYYNSPSKFYEELSFYWTEKGHHHVHHKRERLYEILLEFYRNNDFDDIDVFNEILRFDYVRNVKSTIPEFFITPKMEDYKNRYHEFLQNEENIDKYLSQYKGMPAKKIIKKVNFEVFKYDILNIIEKDEVKPAKENVVFLFDYDIRNKDFGRSKYYRINI